MDLDIKYRPKLFEEFSGSRNVIKLLMRYLEDETLPNVVILNGLTGCGKTTLAYLLTQSLLCLNNKESHNPDPCHQCNVCSELQNSLYINGSPTPGLNVFTFDMSLYGDESEYIKNVVNIIDSPLHGHRKRIILLEELHITQPSLQEKLDRALEFIKQNVYVFICTTNLKKIVGPIQRRGLILNLLIPSSEEQILRLRNICIQEGKPLPDVTLNKIIQISKNNPAKTIKNLGVILSTDEDGIAVLLKEQEKEYAQYIEFFGAIKMGIIEIIDFLESKIVSPAQYILGLQDFIYKVISVRYYAKAVLNDKLRKDIKTEMEAFSDNILVEALRTLYKIGFCSDDDAKRQLFLLSYDINPMLYESTNLSDEINSIEFNKKRGFQTEKNLISNMQENHFGLNKFDSSFNKAMGTISINDL